MSRSGASFFNVAKGSFLCSVETGSEQVSGVLGAAGAGVVMAGFFSGEMLLGCLENNLVNQFMTAALIKNILFGKYDFSTANDVCPECQNIGLFWIDDRASYAGSYQ